MVLAFWKRMRNQAARPFTQLRKNAGVSTYRPSLEGLETRLLPAVLAVFTVGILRIVGDSLDNTIVISRSVAGRLFINGGVIPIVGSFPTVINTGAMEIHGSLGNDTLSLDEANGLLPRALLDGGPGNDILIGGLRNDSLLGGDGNDFFAGQ